MKFFKDFFEFIRDKKILEQQATKDEVIGGKTEFEKKASKAGKKKLRLDYTEKATDPIWQGDNYNQVWKPAVEGALDNPETYEKVLNYLKTYSGQDAVTVKKIIQKEEQAEKQGKGSLKFAIRELATDGKIGPFHTIMRKAVERATGEKIEPLEPKQAKIKPADDPQKQPVVIPTDEPKKDDIISKKMIINVIDRETKKLILTAKYVLQDEDGEELSSGQVDQNAEFSFMIIGPSKFHIIISADGYESFDKNFSFGKDEFSTLTAKEDVVRKTVSLKPIKKEEPEKKPEPKKEPEPEKKPEPTPVSTEKQPKSETSDPATGTIGEKEKTEKQISAKGGNMAERVLNFKYPLTGKEDLLGRYVVSSTDFKVGERNTIRVITNKIGVDKYIYFVSNHVGRAFPVEIYSFKMGAEENDKEFGITPQTKGPLQMTMIVSTVEVKPNTTKKEIDGNMVEGMTEAQCQDFFMSLRKLPKPFEQTAWRGPVFSAITRKFDVQ